MRPGTRSAGSKTLSADEVAETRRLRAFHSHGECGKGDRGATKFSGCVVGLVGRTVCDHHDSARPHEGEGRGLGRPACAKDDGLLSGRAKAGRIECARHTRNVRVEPDKAIGRLHDRVDCANGAGRPHQPRRDSP